jgi:small conductance mechanosensitive channel
MPWGSNVPLSAIQMGVAGAGLVEHGSRIAGIVLVSAALYLLTRNALPRALKAAAAAARKGELSEGDLQRTETLSRVLVHTVGAVILTMAVFMILPELGVNIAPVLAGAGIAGLAIGFGAQSLVKDVIAGLFVMVEDQYTKGDVVCVAGVCGLVEDFNLRRTVLRDLDGAVHYVPNGEVRVASNLTKEYARVNLNISVAYHVDVDRAIEVINRVGLELAGDPQFSPDILEAPQVLRVDELRESGVVIKVLGATRRMRHWDVTGELRRRIKKAFDQEGIEIPFHLGVANTQVMAAGQIGQRLCYSCALKDVAKAGPRNQLQELARLEVYVQAFDHPRQQVGLLLGRRRIPDTPEPLEVGDGEFGESHVYGGNSLQLIPYDPHLSVKLHPINHAVLVQLQHAASATLDRTTMEAQVEDVVLSARKFQGTFLPLLSHLHRPNDFVDLVVDDRRWPVPANGLARDATRSAGLLIVVDALDVMAPRLLPA